MNIKLIVVGKTEEQYLVQGIALRFSLLVAAVFALSAAFVPRGMMRLFTPDPELICPVGFCQRVICLIRYGLFICKKRRVRFDNKKRRIPS